MVAIYYFKDLTSILSRCLPQKYCSIQHVFENKKLRISEWLPYKIPEQSQMLSLRHHVAHDLQPMFGAIKCMVWEEMFFKEFQDGCRAAVVSKF